MISTCRISLGMRLVNLDVRLRNIISLHSKTSPNGHPKQSSRAEVVDLPSAPSCCMQGEATTIFHHYNFRSFAVSASKDFKSNNSKEYVKMRCTNLYRLQTHPHTGEHTPTHARTHARATRTRTRTQTYMILGQRKIGQFSAGKCENSTQQVAACGCCSASESLGAVQDLLNLHPPKTFVMAFHGKKNTTAN